VDRQTPKKAVVVPIERGRRRVKVQPPAAEQRAPRKRFNPLVLILVGLIALCALALAIRAVAAGLVVSDKLAAAMGSGMAIVVGLAGIGALAYAKRIDFICRTKPGSGPWRRGPKTGAFRS
jgi:hypothetical protein